MADANERTAVDVPPDVQPFVYPVEIRFADIDGMRHVNNAVYVTYLENARTAWARETRDFASFEEIGFILGRVEIDFRQAATLGDHVEVVMWVPRIGTKSWDFAYLIRDATDRERVFATARTVQVAFDYMAGRSIPVQEAYLTSLRSMRATSD